MLTSYRENITDNTVAYLVLLAGVFFVLLPHFSHIPAWLILISVLLIFWRAAIALKKLPAPGKKILFIFTLFLITGIVFSYNTIVGKNAGSALLIGLLCLKLFEIKSFRDISVIFNLALFSIVINFLFSQSIPVAITMIIALVLIFTAMISFQHIKVIPRSAITLEFIKQTERPHLRFALKLLLQAIPLAIVLFILFPRVDNPLWGLPEDAFSGKTGLSDQMSPGRISQLSNNTSVAFRVEFNNPVPEQSFLYWRGPVMWNFDGYNWSAPEKDRRVLSSLQVNTYASETNYTITLEPHNNYWIFALDIPTKVPDTSRLSVDMQLLSLKPVQKLQRYSLTSYTNYHLPRVSDVSMQRYLQLPDNSALFIKSRELLKELKVPGNPQQTIQNVLNFFANGDFYYSRSPPLLFDDPVDEFLFSTKKGYCEHYASSFTVLMRLAGIPARVVTGYQGGEINPLDNFMTLRQSDAHAWSEVYLENKGWVRIDPTASIPPANIENSLDAQRLNSNQEKPQRIYDTSWLTKSFKQAQFAWDAINNRWNQWIIGYNSEKQKSLFSAIGIPEISWKGLSQLLFLILGLLTGILAYIVFNPRRNDSTEIQKYYSIFLNKLSKKGLVKQPTEGALTFADRAVAKLPQHKQIIKEISEVYVQLRYRNNTDDSKSDFLKLVKSF